MVHLLSEAKDMELNQYIMDFLVILSNVESNLEQLLDRELFILLERLFILLLSLVTKPSFFSLICLVSTGRQILLALLFIQH